MLARLHGAGDVGTVTSAGVAATAPAAGRDPSVRPDDAPQFVDRFRSLEARISALFVESDLWPNLIIDERRPRIPLILINGRMSEHSFMAPGGVSAHHRGAAAALRSVPRAIARRCRARSRGLGAPRACDDRQSEARRAGAAGRRRPQLAALRNAIGRPRRHRGDFDASGRRRPRVIDSAPPAAAIVSRAC